MLARLDTVPGSCPEYDDLSYFAKVIYFRPVRPAPIRPSRSSLACAAPRSAFTTTWRALSIGLCERNGLAREQPPHQQWRTVFAGHGCSAAASGFAAMERLLAAL